MEQPPPLRGVVIISQHLIIAMDGRCRLALSLAGAGAGARGTRTTGYIHPRDLYTLKLITLLLRGNANLI
jgi:hypothetical protein